MILLWFLLGIVLIFGIARYNESNKLFWTLLLTYVMGFAVTKMVLQTVNGSEQGNVNLTEVSSTQESASALAITLFQIAAGTTPSNVTDSNPVSQSFASVTSKDNIILSEVFGRTRDQPQSTLIKPPELCLTKIISTLHDTG